MSARPHSTTEDHRRRWGPRVLVLALIGGSFGLALEAAAASRNLTYPDRGPPVATFAAPRPSPAPPPSERLVWQGVDIDGDGQPDFTNPTGLPVRTCDDYGCGAFGSQRDAGERRHEGVDFDAVAGQAVKAPLSGFVTKVGLAYPDDASLKFVEITNPALGYVARVFYVEPAVVEGQAVRLGDQIGQARSLQQRYPGITNHVHLEIARQGRSRIDATRLIVARLQPGAPPNTALAENVRPAARRS